MMPSKPELLGKPRESLVAANFFDSGAGARHAGSGWLFGGAAGGSRSMKNLGPTPCCFIAAAIDRKSTRLNSSHSQISYAVFCLKKKIKIINKFQMRLM